MMVLVDSEADQVDQSALIKMGLDHPFGQLFPCSYYMPESRNRCGSRIQVKGPQLQRPKAANRAEGSHASKASYLWPGSRVHLRALEAFGVLMLKYAFSTF